MSIERSGIFPYPDESNVDRQRMTTTNKIAKTVRNSSMESIIYNIEYFTCIPTDKTFRLNHLRISISYLRLYIEVTYTKRIAIES
jgi:hypothetical protein